MDQVEGQAPLAKDGMDDQSLHSDVQGVLHQVAPLLVGDCLASSERLSMFRCSKAAAGMVLQHAPCINLLLSADNDSAASSSQRNAAMQLASQAAPRVMLTMHQGLVVPLEPLWQRLTVLSLSNLHLYSDSFGPLLRLSTPQHLHTLQLKHCLLQNSRGTQCSESGYGNNATGAGGSGGGCTSGGDSSTGVAVRTLQCVGCKPEGSCLAIVLSLIDRSQLQQLSTDAGQDVTTHLHVLPHLQQLHMPCAVIQDQAFQRVLSHPSLVEITAAFTDLDQDHSAMQPASLQKIELISLLGDFRGTHICTLAALPLAHLRCCTVRTGLVCCATSDSMNVAVLAAALSKVALHQDKVECKPRKGAFSLYLEEHYSASQVQQFISLCTRNLLQGNQLVIDSPPTTALTALSTALPTAVTAIAFDGDISSLLQVPGSFINFLPAPVSSVTLSHQILSMNELQQILLGVARRIKVVFRHLLTSGVTAGSEEKLIAWIQGRVSEWLSSYPNEVTVEVQKVSSCM